MDPLSAIGLGVQAAGGLANFFAGQSAAEKAALLADENFKRWMAIQIPDPRDQELALKQLTSVGQLSPQLEAQINQVPTELDKVVTDPQTRQAQMNALQSLQDQGHGGMSLRDEATLQEAQTQNQNQARGNSAAIMQDLARRGATNSGFGVAAQLSNAQNTANNNASAGLSAAASAQERALEAIQGAGNLAGSMQAADLGQQNTVAKSKDAINQFNTNNLQNVQMRNVNSLNAAQAANLGNAQRISDTNAGISNDQQRYNKELLQQNYENQMKQAAGANSANNDKAAASNQGAANFGNFATNLTNGIGGALATKGAQDYQAQQQKDWWQSYKDAQQPAAPRMQAQGLNPNNQAAVDRIKADVAQDEYKKRSYTGS